MQVEFNTLEYMYLASVSGKMMKARKDFDDKIMSKGVNAIIKELSVKFSTHVETQTTHTVPLKRTHIRFLQEMLGKSLVVIDEKIIPEYQARPNAAELTSYVTKLEQTREMVKELLTKLEKAL